MLAKKTLFHSYMGINQFMMIKYNQEGYALIYCLCFGDKDVFADIVLHKSATDQIHSFVVIS